MTRPTIDKQFLQQAVERGLMTLDRGREVVTQARRLAAAGKPVDVLELTVAGQSADDAVVLRWLYGEIKAEHEGAPVGPPTTGRVLASKEEEAPKKRSETKRMAGPPKFEEPGPPGVQTTIAPGYVRPSKPLAPPPKQIGNYEVFETLGRGASGSVYRCRHVFVQNEVAVKVLHEGANADQTERFFREAKAATVLRHPNLVSVLDLGLHEDDRPYLVMELVEGEPLLTVIRRDGPLETLRAAAYTEQIARGLEEAHKTLLHRDIKPENILVHGEVARLTDFGLVRNVRKTERLTSMGDLLGSPAYMSPEQARGEVDLDARTDVYGLGASLYEMLAGRAPFGGTNLNEVLLAVIDDPPTPPAALNPKTDPILERICLRCLAKKPEQRFPNAAALAGELARFRAYRT